MKARRLRNECCSACGAELKARAFGIAVFAVHFNSSELKIVKALVKAAGETVAYDRLLLLAYEGRELKHPFGALRTMISMINDRIMPFGYVIRSAYSHGYRLMKTGRRLTIEAEIIESQWTPADIVRS